LIVFRGKGSGQILRPWREVLASNQIGLNGMTIGHQIIEQPAEAKQIVAAGLVA